MSTVAKNRSGEAELVGHRHRQLPAPADLYSASGKPRVVVFRRGDLDPSVEHTLEVRALGTKNASSSGTRIDVDAFVVLHDPSNADAKVADTGTTAPDISDLSPKPNSKIRGRTRRIRATITDNNLDKQLAKRDITLTVAGKNIPAAKFRYDPETGRLDYTSKKLSYGKKVLSIEARDAAGNEAVKSWRFTIVKKRR